MHRFFVPPELLTNLAPLAGARYELSQIVTLPKDLVHQVRNVLRLNVGEQLLLLDNSGDEILATIAKTSKTAVEVHLLERRPGKSEPAVRIILCQGLLKSARFEWILEKGTELGVSVFSPIICRRSMVGLEYTGSTKIQRWQRIIQEAAEQSGRSRLPELLPTRLLDHALKDIPPRALAIMPWEEEHALTLHDVLTASTPPTGNVGATLAVARSPHDVLTASNHTTGNVGVPLAGARSPHDVLKTSTPPTGNVGVPLAGARPIRPVLPQPTSNPSTPTPESTTTVVLFIGPEGGLTAEEVSLAQQYGVQVVSLGSRILRAETAALTAVANVIYELEH